MSHAGIDFYIGKREVVSSYVSHFLQYGSSIIVLPLLLRKLSAEELAVWYIFLSISMFVNLLDFGFLPTVMRYVSYVFSGAQELEADKVGGHYDSKINYGLLKTLIFVVRFFYAFMAILVLVVLFFVGYFYVCPMISNVDNAYNIKIAWFINVITTCISVYFCYYSGLLNGRGLVYKYQRSIIVSKIVYILVCFLGVMLDYGIIAIVFANMCSIVLSRILENLSFYDNELKKNLCNVDINNSLSKKYFLLLCKSSYRLGIVNLGAFLILRANILLCAKYLDLKQVAQYGVSLQIVQVLVVMSSVLYNAQMPIFHNLRVVNEKEGLLVNFSVSIVASWIIYFFGAIFVLLFGDKVLRYIGSNVQILGSKELFILILASLLELNHSLFASFITTKNIVPFVVPAIVSGAMISFASFVMLSMTSWGVFGVLLAQFFVQAVYNNWKWPLVVLEDFDIKFAEFVKCGFLNMIKKLKCVILW